MVVRDVAPDALLRRSRAPPRHAPITRGAQRSLEEAVRAVDDPAGVGWDAGNVLAETATGPSLLGRLFGWTLRSGRALLERSERPARPAAARDPLCDTCNGGSTALAVMEPRSVRLGTHRLAAILRIVNEGDLGALRMTDVVGCHGETVQDLVNLYRACRLRTYGGQSRFEESNAREMVQSIRQHGYVSDAAAARATGDIGSFYKDEIGPIETVLGREDPLFDSDPRVRDFVGTPRGR